MKEEQNHKKEYVNEKDVIIDEKRGQNGASLKELTTTYRHPR